MLSLVEFFLEAHFIALTLLVGWQEGHPACKKTERWVAGMVICLERGADLQMAQLMPLPLTVSCFSNIQIGFTFLVPAYQGSPRKRAVKQVCVCVCVCVHTSLLLVLDFTISVYFSPGAENLSYATVKRWKFIARCGKGYFLNGSTCPNGCLDSVIILT